jgi:hypothetical protein
MRSLLKKLNLLSPVKLTGVITLTACLFFLAGAAGATVLYDNLSSPSGSVWTITNFGGGLYNSFSTGAGSFELRRVELLVAGSAEPAETDSFSVDLYSAVTVSDDKSTLNTTFLQHIGTVSDSTLTPDYSLVTLNLPSACSLAANTRYWVGLTSAASSAGWVYAADSNGVGVAYEYWADNYPGYPEVVANIGDNGYSTYPFQMRVSDVPLPASVLLLGSGLLGLGLLRLWGREKKV